jgi:hypothetical protein
MELVILLLFRVAVVLDISVETRAWRQHPCKFCVIQQDEELSRLYSYSVVWSRLYKTGRTSSYNERSISMTLVEKANN